MAYPVGLIGNMLRRYERDLKSLAFQDNEHGDTGNAINTLMANRIQKPINIALARGGKSLRVLRLCISAERHHTLSVSYEVRGAVVAYGHLTVALFEPSKKAQAQERAAEALGETVDMSAPARGAPKKKKIPRRRWRGRKATAAKPPPTSAVE
jgi:hypothetical protein